MNFVTFFHDSKTQAVRIFIYPYRSFLEVWNLFCKKGSTIHLSSNGTEDSIACVAETGNDISVIVELFIKCRGIDINVGVILLNLCNTLGCSNEAHELDVLTAVLLELGQRIACRAARDKHRIDEDDYSLVDICGELTIICYGKVSFGITVKTDVSYLCNGNEIKKSVHHTDTCSEDRNDSKLFTRYRVCLGLADGSLDSDLFKRKVAGQLISHKHCDLIKKLAEILGASLFVSHNGELVRDQRMVYYVKLAHNHYILSVSADYFVIKYYTLFFLIFQVLFSK